MASCNDDAVVAQVLQIMVQHVEDLSIREIARLLQLSSKCRRALQQAVGCLKISSCRFRSVAATTGFAAWLPHHAGLLQELPLFKPSRSATAGEEAGWAAVEQLIVFALQISSTPPGVPAEALARPQPPSQHAPLLRLRSFSTDYVHSPAALHSLATCNTLTALLLVRVPRERFTIALCGAIAQLRSLRKLRCFAAGEHFVYPSGFATAVGQLTQLEELEALDRLLVAGLPQLAASLTKACLDVDHTDDSAADINISQLSRLRSLELSVLGRISAQSQLPASLTALTLLGAADAVAGLSQLQVLNLFRPAACLPLMQRLPRLPRLKRVLVGLHECGQEQFEPVLAALSAGTQLTGLHLYARDSTQEEDGPGIGEEHLNMQQVVLHSFLRKLPLLQLLHVSGLELGLSDLVHFTKLTTLTDLKISHCRGELDLGLAAIMQRLTGLRALHLESLELSSPLIWVAAADLTNLQVLKVMLCSGIAHTDDTLHLLAPLTKLTDLVLDDPAIVADGQDDVSAHVVRRLLRQLPLLQEIDWV